MKTNIKVTRGTKGEIKKAIVTKAFLRKANQYGTSEYYELQAFRKDNPNVEISTRNINSNKKTYANHTYKHMEQFIKTQPNAKENLAEMKRIREASAIHAKPYNVVLNWFLERFENTYEYKLYFKNDNNEKENTEQEKVTENTAMISAVA